MTNTTITPLAWLLICLVVALMYVLGVRLPVGDTVMVVLALLVAGEIWRKMR